MQKLKSTITSIFSILIFYGANAQCGMSLSLASTNVTCNGGTDGTITPTVTGGTAPYTYSGLGLSTSIANGTFTNLAIGNYVVIVTDSNGCSVTATATITEPAVLTLSLTTTSATCNGTNNGTIVPYTTGGTPAYTYSCGCYSTTFDDLVSGTYSITVADANGCTASASDSVSEPEPLDVSIIVSSDTICAGETDTLTAILNNVSSGGASYVWNTAVSSQVMYVTMAGTYVVTTTNSIGCSATASYVVIPCASSCNAQFSISQDSATVWTIYNTSSVATLSTYMWYWGDGDSTVGIAPSHTYASAGTYAICLHVTGASGCDSWYCDTSTYMFKTDATVTVNVIDATQGTSGVSTIEKNNVSIYPNPFTDKLTIEPKISYQLFDMLGREVDKNNLAALPVGTYILKTDYGSTRVVKVE